MASLRDALLSIFWINFALSSASWGMNWWSAPEHKFEDSQWLPGTLAQVFAFFSSEQNLEVITPPWLNFAIAGKSTAEIEKGTVIDYRLSLHGWSMKWRTEIEVWEPGREFVDNQIQGPYARWHHTHRFAAERGGTLMSDSVLYKLPFGRLGDWAAHWKVKRQVREIFAYRRKVIGQIFADAAT